MGAGRGDAHARSRRGEPPASVVQVSGELRQIVADRADDLQLRRRQLQLEGGPVADLRDQLGGAWREVERLWIEQHHLLLDPERRRPGVVEQGPQGLRVRSAHAAALAFRRRH
jgi:hypothetical protein